MSARHEAQHVREIGEANARPLDDAARVGGAALQQEHVRNARQLLEIGEVERSHQLRQSPRIDLNLQLLVVVLEPDQAEAGRGRPHERIGDRPGLLA